MIIFITSGPGAEFFLCKNLFYCIQATSFGEANKKSQKKVSKWKKDEKKGIPMHPKW